MLPRVACRVCAPILDHISAESVQPHLGGASQGYSGRLRQPSRWANPVGSKQVESEVLLKQAHEGLTARSKLHTQPDLVSLVPQRLVQEHGKSSLDG